MSMYTDMSRGALEQVGNSLRGGSKEGIMATLMVGIVYALLAIAAAIADLKP